MSKFYGSKPWFAVVDDIAPSTPVDPKLGLYWRTLCQLRTRGAHWESNYNKYRKRSPEQQAKWVRYIEQNALKGPPLPMARELYMMALTLRMTT